MEESLRAYELVISKFGYNTVVSPGSIDLLGWHLEYICGPALASFIDQILVRRLNDFIADSDHPVILDCGANIGFSVLNYKRQFPNSKITAFEPDPQFAPVLRRNLANNGAFDVEIVEAAAWIRKGKVKWHCEGIDGSKISSSDSKGKNITTVPSVDLAHYLGREVDLLKLDVEGTEYALINHLGERLKKARNLIIECHVDQSNVADFGRMLTTLKSFGFNLSVNSFGLWRDLIRHAPVETDHWEQYLIVAARHDELLKSCYDDYTSAYIGAHQLLEFQKLQIESARFRSLEATYSLLVKSFVANPSTRTKPIRLPFESDGGQCWVARLPELQSVADQEEAPSRSTLLLIEDDRLLAPAHSVHADIRLLGGGRYSHWKSQLYFSTSDNTDPNVNGRTYRISVASTER